MITRKLLVLLMVTCTTAFADTVTVPRWVAAASDFAPSRMTTIYTLLLFSGRYDPQAPEGSIMGAFADGQKCARASEVMNSQAGARRGDGRPAWLCVPTTLVFYKEKGK